MTTVMRPGPGVRIHVQAGINEHHLQEAAKRLLEQLKEFRRDFPDFQLALLDANGNVVEKVRIFNENRNMLRDTPMVLYSQSR